MFNYVGTSWSCIAETIIKLAGEENCQDGRKWSYYNLLPFVQCLILFINDYKFWLQ